MEPWTPSFKNEQARRARAAITHSLDSIARSKQRISDSRLKLKAREAWTINGVELTDAQWGALLERRQAQAEQHEIEREMSLTLLGRDRDEAA